MINYIKGIFIESTSEKIIVENNGIAYDMFFPASNMANLPVENSEIKVYTYMSVREDDISLYGFLTEEDRDVFLMLLTVNGVGPKGALNIISTFGFNETVRLITKGDNKKLSEVKGLGQKTASKIIIELSDKIKKINIGNTKDFIKENNEVNEKINLIKEEVVEALVSLGHQKKAAVDMVSSIHCDENMRADELLKMVLKQ